MTLMNKNQDGKIRTMHKWLWPALLIGIAFLARLLPGTRTIDDAYITFRYAQNILTGTGFSFNPGETVLGTTTPLYTLLMVFLGAFTGGVDAPFPTLALGVNALADALTCLLLLRLGRSLGKGQIGLITALAWAVAPFSVTFAIGGLETSLFVFLLTAMLLAHLEHRRVLAALLGALAILTRPDALILVGMVVLARFWELLKQRKDPSAGKTILMEIAVFSLPLMMWFGYAWSTFGSPIPQSMLAKLAAYHLDSNAALIRLIQHYTTPFLEDNWLGSIAAVAAGLILYPFLFLVGVRRGWKLEPRLLPWMLYPIAYFIIFAMPNPLLFRWYLTPPLPAWIFFIFLGLETILIGKNTDQTLSTLRRAIILVVMLLFPLLSLREWQVHPTHGPDRPAPEMAFIELELIYAQAADWLTPRLQSGDVVAAGDVGVLGYMTNARMLDTVGLNSPVSTAYYPLLDNAYVINYAIPTDLILDERPNYLVILEVYGRNTLLVDDRFLAEYAQVYSLPTDIYGSRDLLIFQRNLPY